MKTCSKCGKQKTLEEYSWKIKDHKKRSACKQCMALLSAAHYRNNKTLYQERNKSRHAVKRQELIPGLTKYCEYGCGGIVTYSSQGCRGCVKDLSQLERYALWKAGDPSVLPKSALKTGIIQDFTRRQFFLDHGSKCSKCSWTHIFQDYPEKIPPLHVSHKNDDYQDMRYDNLELLCPNCHAIHTTLNPTQRGQGRKTRK